MSNAASKQKLELQLAELAGISKKDAQTILKKFSYNINVALDGIFNGSIKVNQSSATQNASLEKIFTKYKEKDSDEIGIDGTIQFITDLKLDLEDPVVLAIAKELQSPRVALFTKRGFIDGWRNLDCTTFDQMIATAKRLDHKMKTDDDYFHEIYKFVFSYNLAEAQRLLPYETAVANWNLLLGDRFSKLNEWNDFIINKYKRNISKDVWNMTWEFAKHVQNDPNLNDYNDEAAWPSVIDEFVHLIKSQN